MITFVEFLELCESSTGESGRRRVSSRGPSANRSDRNKQRQDNSNRAALSKAGFSRSPRPVTGKGGRKTKWTETSTSSHHDTETGTYANQSDYATSKIGNLGPKGNKPTSKRALKAKQIRKQLGGDRTPRQVHDVAVNKKRTYDDDNSSTMTKGRSFRKEVTKGVSDNLKKAGAKSGDIVTSTPTSDSRSRMYGKTHNTKTSKRTGVTVNRIREWIDISEKSFPSRKEAEDYHKENPPYGNEPYHIRRKNRRGEPESWRPVRASRRNAQGKTRQTKAQDQTDPNVKSSEYKGKVSRITSQGKEAHHRVSLDRAASLFKGKSPEQQQEIRRRHAKVGVHFGNDPKNLIGLSRERHTGGGDSVHRETEKMDRSIKKAGNESSKVFDAIKKLRSR